MFVTINVQAGPCGPQRKVSRPDPNVANECRDRVLARFPELREKDVSGVWFTGSNIWTTALGEPAPDGADWDIVLVDDSGDRGFGSQNTPWEAGEELREKLGLDPANTIPTWRKHEGSSPPKGASDGLCFRTSRGEVDVWSSPDGTILGALREYKTATHAHCRAAFSLTYGLVVLPNELSPSVVSAHWTDIEPEPRQKFGVYVLLFAALVMILAAILSTP